MDLSCFNTLLTETVIDQNSLDTVWGMPTFICWIVIVILLFVSGMFSAGENAYSNCNKYHFKAQANKGKITSKIICRLVDKFDDTLITILVSNNIVQTIMSFLSAMLFYNLCQKYGLGSGVEAILSTLVMSFLIYIVSDTAPKILSKEFPNRMAILLAYPVSFMMVILYPIDKLFKLILVAIHKIFKVQDENLLSKDDLIAQAKVAVNEETVDEDDEDNEGEKLFENEEEELLSNVFDFDTLRVKDVYTPKEKVLSIDIENLTINELNEKIVESPYSRIPVYEGNKDEIIGILVFKSYFEKYARDTHLDIKSVLEEVVKVHLNDRIDEVLERLNKEKVHLGIVVDENDKMVGVVSMEDILEELVDDIDEKNPNNIELQEGKSL